MDLVCVLSVLVWCEHSGHVSTGCPGSRACACGLLQPPRHVPATRCSHAGADFDKRLNVFKPKLDGGGGTTCGTVVTGEGIVIGPPPPPGGSPRVAAALPLCRMLHLTHCLPPCLSPSLCVNVCVSFGGGAAYLVLVRVVSCHVMSCHVVCVLCVTTVVRSPKCFDARLDKTARTPWQGARRWQWRECCNGQGLQAQEVTNRCWGGVRLC